VYVQITRKAETLLWLRLFNNTDYHSVRVDLGLAARDVRMSRHIPIPLLLVMVLGWGYPSDHRYDPQLNSRRELRRVVFETITSMDTSAPLYESAIKDLLAYAKMKNFNDNWGSELEYLIREEVMR
jgi:hypothetical protein